MTGGQQRFAFAAGPEREQFAPGAWLLRGFARQAATDLLVGIHAIAHVAPFRRMARANSLTRNRTFTWPA